MQHMIRFTKYFVDFTRMVVGTIETPYETFRTIALRPYLYHLVFIMGLVGLYLGLSTLIRGGLRASPLFLTASFVKVGVGAMISFVFVTSLVYCLGFVFGDRKEYGKKVFLRIMVLWGYTLLPTTVWFLTTSFFYYLLPPPRSVHVLGQLASACFITLSIGALCWKAILYYLTLRFGLRFTLQKIVATSIVFLPITVLYSLVMYRFGIFRVPFL